MPGNRARSGTKKHFRTTGSGKPTRKTANKRHLLKHRSSRRTYRLSQGQVVAPSGVGRVKKLLGK